MPSNSENITVGSFEDAINTGIAQANKAVTAVTTGINNAVNNAVSTATGGLFSSNPFADALTSTLPKKNILTKYASYNCVFTLGVLTNDELNFPDLTYRKNGPSVLILRTGGTGNKQPRTLLEQSVGITGEYFIDDIEIDTIIAPSPKTKQTNATSIAFKVVEPYSMGLFLQTLMLAALKGGHKNYLEAPYLLQVEFIGWDDNGRPLNIPKSKRMFPLKFANVDFNVTQSGSEYKIDCIPWQEHAFSDSTQNTKTDVSMKGATLVELLQTGPESLATIFNQRELDLVKSGSKKIGDQYVILFPKDRNAAKEAVGTGGVAAKGATTQSKVDDLSVQRDLSEERKQEIYQALTGITNNKVPADFDAELSKILGIVVKRSNLGESIREWAEKPENLNDIGKAKIVKSFLDSGKPAFGKPAFTVDPKKPGVFQRGNIQISDEGRRIEFKQTSKIQNIIEELILLSDYGRAFATSQPDGNGMKDWFKIEANVYNISDPAQVAQSGQTAKIYVYKVMPWKVHVSRISSPTQTTPSFPKLKKQVMREYNYIYTGKNDDVIRFDIQLNSAFFTALQGDFGQLGKDSKLQGANARTAPPQAPVSGAADGNTQVAGAIAATKQTNTTTTGKSGSGVQVHPETQVARSFNDAIVNSPTDLVSANMEIWGDPYYIADSGMGNYDAPEGSFNMNADGSLEYQTGEVDILINFRTPIDYGRDGIMKFPQGGTKPVGAFSGLYQVLTVKNKFNGNKFTQELETIRRRNQEIEGGVDIGVESIVEKGLDAIISPLAAAPAAAFANAKAELEKAIGGIGGIASATQALQQAQGQIQGAAGNILGAASGALNSAATKVNSAVDQAKAAIANPFKDAL